MNILIKNIELEIDTRVKKLLDIEKIIFTNTYKLTNEHKELIALQSITMIYSIWEGFINYIFNYYIEHLNKKEIDFDDYFLEIKIYNIETNFKQLKEPPSKIGDKEKFYKKLKIFFNKEKTEIPIGFNTENNVGFTVLNKLLKMFNLEVFKEHWGIYTYPENSLKVELNTFLRYRNNISHGGESSNEQIITQEIYSKYSTMIKNLMYEILSKIEKGLRNQSFLIKKID